MGQKIDKKVLLDEIVPQLCSEESYHSVYHRINHDVPMPSLVELRIIVNNIRAILFPGYFGNSDMKPQVMAYYIGSLVDSVNNQLAEQIKRGFCFAAGSSDGLDSGNCVACEEKSAEIAAEFCKKLPFLRKILATDAQAAFDGDPAAKFIGETIFCYPSLKALTNHRIAHELFKLGVPLIPRMISEMAHSETGIDIHPGADIDEYFFIDHGTGVVIGETCVIGKHVGLYQGVTLGAKSFPKDEHGNPIKGIPRHPIVEDNVIIYSGATILGRVTIGKGSVIGGNVWLTESTPAGAKILK